MSILCAEAAILLFIGFLEPPADSADKTWVRITMLVMSVVCLALASWAWYVDHR